MLTTYVAVSLLTARLEGSDEQMLAHMVSPDGFSVGKYAPNTQVRIRHPWHPAVRKLRQKALV